MAPVRSEEYAVRLHERYQADIWVEVDTDGEAVLSVVVREVTMATPVDE